MSFPTGIQRRDFLRLILLGGGTVIAGSALGACGVTTSASTTGTNNTGDTRTVADVNDNEVTVPTNPQRIVTLSEPTVDGVLALGLTPIGAVAGRGQDNIPNYLLDPSREIPVFGTVAAPNFEVIGAAHPDLILVDGTSVNNNQPVLDQLAAIAPVVYTGYAGGDWKANFRLTAQAVNKADEGEQVIADYEQAVAKASEALASYQDSTFSIVRWQGNNGSLILKELPAGQALTDLGLKRPPSQDRQGRGHSEPVSLENLGDLDADYMFFGTLGGSSVGNQQAGGNSDTQAAIDAVAQAATLPGFSELFAYKANHIIPVDGSVWTSTGGPLLMRRIVDDIVSALV